MCVYVKSEEWYTARNEHYFISKAKIEYDTASLLLRYGSLERADNRLLDLEYFLNYGEKRK